MKKTLSQRFFLPLCLLTLFGILGGNHAWAAVGDVFYTLTCSKNANNSGYTNYYDVKVSGITWNAPGNQSLGEYWRIGGGKKPNTITNVDRTITAKNAIGSKISKVTLNHNGVNNTKLKVNSISLTIASDADFTKDVQTVTIESPSVSKSTVGSFDFTPEGESWAKDSYYKLTVNVTNSSTSSNYGFDITSLVFYGMASSEPTLKTSVTSLTFPQTESGQTATQTFTLSGINLTANAGLAITGTGAGMFSVSPSSVSPTDGTISDKEVTVTYAPTAAGSHEATLTVSSTGATDQVISLSGTAIAPLQHYTVNWMVNGNPYSEGTPSTDVAEGESVETLPTTPAAIGDKVFMGWTNATIVGTQDVAPEVLFTSATDAPEVTANTTYFAVFATQSGSAPVESLIQTLAYDTWTYSGSTTNKASNNYRLFHTDSYIESETFDLSKLTKVVVYGGTFGGDSYNKLNIGDGTNTWKDVTVSGSSQTGVNTFTGGTALSGEGKLRITSKSGTASSNGVRISKVEIYTTEGGYTYSAYATNFATLSNRNLAFSESAVDCFDGTFTAPTLSGQTDGVTYASSDTEVATVNETTGDITIGTKFGTTTITASAEQSGSYYADEASYTISVWPNSISRLKTLITSTSEIDFKVKLNNAIITYADANNAYLQDADAAILIYVKGHGLTEGKSYTGVVSGKAKLYNGLREITSIDWGTIIPESAAVPAAEIVTLADLNADYDKYESMFVLVQNAIVSSALTSKNATISQDSEEYAVYDKKDGLSATALSTTNAIVNLYGFPGKFNTTLQLNVFNDIDVEETGYNLVVSAAGYATYFNSTEAFTMPAGATGYVWFEGKIELAYNPAADVPAKEPLVIKATAGNYPLWFTSSTKVTWKSDGMNALEGTDVETPITDDDAYYFYGLSLNASSDLASVGFYWMNPTGAAFTNGAHKAYLKLAKNTSAGSQAVNGFPFNGTTTGIEQIEAGADAKNAIYDLSGRRVNKAAKGIYILNGKKVLVK